MRETWHGKAALMRVLYTRPSAKRNVSLFPNCRAAGINLIVYSIMPSGGGAGFAIWHRSFLRNRLKPKRKVSP